MKRTGSENKGNLRDQLHERVDAFAGRLQDEAKGIESRVKEGIRDVVDESKRQDRWLGRAPGLSRRPPRGTPPNGRPPSP